jgi:hypothetical protein
VAELLDRVSSEEITEWSAVWRLRRQEEEKAHKEAERRSRGRR